MNTILGAEVNVRLLRAVSLAAAPMNRSELARAAGVETRGAYLAADRLLKQGILMPVGMGVRRALALETTHPLAGPIRALFQAEQARVERLLETLQTATARVSDLDAAWIQGGFARGDDRPGDPLLVGLLANGRVIGSVGKRLREALDPIEHTHDITIELISFTRADLAAATPEELQELAGALPLYGPLPAVTVDSPQPPNDRRHVAAHRNRDHDALALARAIADQLAVDPGLRSAAQRYVQKRLKTASERERQTLEEWADILRTMSPRRLRQFLTDPGERATRLRQTLPFPGALSPQERATILARYGEHDS